MLIQHDRLRAIVRDICAAAGSTGDEPALVAENLVYANLTGHDSHGVGMLPRYVSCVLSGTLKPNQHVRVVRDEGTMVVLDGQAGYGQVIGGEVFNTVSAEVRQRLLGSLEGALFVAMEFIDGSTLTDWLTEDVRTWQDIAEKFRLATRRAASS